MRRVPFAPSVLAGIALTVASATPALAEPPVQEIVRVGDHDMTCAALASEINTLAQPAPDRPTPKPKKRGLGFLSMLGGVVPFAGMGGAVLSSAAGAAQMAGAGGGGVDAAQTDRMIREAMAGGSPAEQRKERLTTIFEEKRC